MTRNLKRRSSEATQLVISYVNAHEKIYGKAPYVHPNNYARFEKFEKVLRDEGIGCRDYAYVVVAILEKWARKKGWEHIPLNTFLGKYGLRKYKKVASQSSVDVSTDDKDTIIHSELMVARLYIEANTRNGNVVRMMKVVDEIRDVLSDEWLHIYDNGMKRPITEVVEILSDEYGLKFATDYNDIVDALR